MEDGSLDYSADWDTFSFETEVNTRKCILNEDLKAYKELLSQLSCDNSEDIDNVLTELRTNKELSEELLTKNENIFAKYQSLIENHKNIKEIFEKLAAKNNSLEKVIKTLKEEESVTYKQYQQTKLALSKASDMYTTYFDIDISTKALSDTIYEASLHFKGKSDIAPIKFIVDREKRKFVDFQLNGVLSAEEEKKIRDEFSNSTNLPALFCALRDIILHK